ncbi:MAG: TetR/AcrR family transcriptional regulator [Hominenteromicrobium sp.]
MARTPRITPEMLVDAGVKLVLEEGIGALNIRSLAARIGCSIQPIFRNFGSMDALRAEILRGLDAVYQAFIAERVDKNDYLFTISLAHIALAGEQRNLFGAMFLTGEFGTRTVGQIIQSSWNRETIECTAEQYGLSLPEAEAVYRDVRFYTFGIAQSVYAGTVMLEDGEAASLLRSAIACFAGKPRV